MNEADLTMLPGAATACGAAGRECLGEPAWARSHAMTGLLTAVERLAKAPTPLLLSGETGVGKDWLARLIHRKSGRPGPLLTVPCEGLTADRLEELMPQPGLDRWEGPPSGATLLFQEVSRLPAEAQSRLAERIDLTDPPQGAWAPEDPALDIRVLASSTEDLARSVSFGAFLPRLYYRLTAVELRIPSLRQRREDIEGLVALLLSELEQKYDLGPFAATDALLDAFRSAPWPGNVRQLRSVLERAIVLSTQGLLDASTLPADWACSEAPAPFEVRIGTTLAEVEQRLILETLRFVGGHRLQAAKVLGISRRKLHYRLRQYREQGLGG